MTDLDLRLADLVGADADSTTPTPAARPISTAGMDFAPQQIEAIEKISQWWTERPEQQVFRLFGYAGTGKTTLARHIVDQLGITALYAAFTGKAAYVLRSKGCEGASTIHSLIYAPQEKVRAHLYELRGQLDALDAPRDPDSLDIEVPADPAEREMLERAIAAETERLATPDFILRTPEECVLAGAPLLVLDEVSMVGSRIAADLLSFGVRILCLGDPAQLPPVEGGGYFIHAQPDHLLTEIHRSALDSPVTRLATSVRQSPPGDRSLGMAGMDGDSGRKPYVSRDELTAVDQVLVGTNKTRWAAIHLLRHLHGLTSPMPQAGDRIIGLANSVEADIFNGQQFRVTDVRPQTTEAKITLHVEDDAGYSRWLTCWTSGFTGFEGEKQARREGRGNVAAATFAQAITCHKSQGSQWDSVLVVDESYVFARGQATELTRAGHPPAAAAAAGHIAGQRWLYTAITRAAQQVVVIPSPTGLPS